MSAAAKVGIGTRLGFVELGQHPEAGKDQWWLRCPHCGVEVTGLTLGDALGGAADAFLPQHGPHCGQAPLTAEEHPQQGRLW